MRTVKDSTAELNDYIHRQGLGQFYAPDDPCVNSLVQQAAELIQNHPPELIMATPQQYSEMTKIVLYTTTILVNNSGSMATGDRIQAVKNALVRITTIAPSFETDGIMIRFLNSSDSQADLTDPVKNVEQVENIFRVIQHALV